MNGKIKASEFRPLASRLLRIGIDQRNLGSPSPQFGRERNRNRRRPFAALQQCALADGLDA
jgi:hypothetical protein